MEPLRNPVSLAHRIRRKGLTVIKLFKGRLLNRSILVFHFSISNRRREITSPTGTWIRSKTRAACYRTHSPLLSSLLSQGRTWNPSPRCVFFVFPLQIYQAYIRAYL